MSETLTTRVSLYGRFADDLTRAPVSGSQFTATLSPGRHAARRKSDGYFVFADVPASTGPYQLNVAASGYQSRRFSVALPTTDPVELDAAGEDELFVLVTGVPAAGQRVDFAPVSFLPTIRAGARVFGPGGFTSTLTQPLEGSGVTFATLSSTAGLATGNLLRIVRSSSLLLAPGPDYRFEAPLTLVAFRVVEDTAGDPAIAEADLVVDRVNGVALATTTIAGVALRTATLPGPVELILGTERSLRTTSSNRGDALLHFPSDTPITNLRLRVTRPGYQTLTPVVNITAGLRTGITLRLNRT